MVKRKLFLFPGMVMVGAFVAVASLGQDAPEASVPEGSVPEEAAEETGLYSRSRYDVIIQRSPFGEEVPDDSSKATDPTVQQMEKEMRLCFLLENQSGEIRAGFENLKAKKGEPRSIMLLEGESFRAMKLVNIDLKNSTATLDYMGKNVTFDLTKAKAATASKAKVPTAPVQPERRFGGGFRRTTPPVEPVQPEPEQPQLSAEEQAQQQEEIRQNLQQYQMDVIRQGMPPLPIPLTEEMDAQLVSEGVLPPPE